MIMANTLNGSSQLNSSVGPSQIKRRSLTPLLVLLTLNGIAGAGVWHAMKRPIEITPIIGPDSPATLERQSIVPGPRLPGQRNVAELPETARRPLFSASRRPWVEKPKPETAVVKVIAPPAVVAPPYPANQLQLKGVNPGNRNFPARALIRAGNETTGTWVQVGESVRGWKLRELPTLDSAIIETRGERVELVTDATSTVGETSHQQQQPRR
jgi:hypothetical protein